MLQRRAVRSEGRERTRRATRTLVNAGSRRATILPLFEAVLAARLCYSASAFQLNEAYYIELD